MAREPVGSRLRVKPLQVRVLSLPLYDRVNNPAEWRNFWHTHQARLAWRDYNPHCRFDSCLSYFFIPKAGFALLNSAKPPKHLLH